MGLVWCYLSVTYLVGCLFSSGRSPGFVERIWVCDWLVRFTLACGWVRAGWSAMVCSILALWEYVCCVWGLCLAWMVGVWLVNSVVLLELVCRFPVFVGVFDVCNGRFIVYYLVVVFVVAVTLFDLLFGFLFGFADGCC